MKTPANRMSSLPVAEYCGLSAKIVTPTMIEGRQSTAFHQRAAGDPRWVESAAALPPDLREELDAWVLPESVDVHGLVLLWANATKEQEIHCPDTGSVGHPDAYWLVGDCVYVCDIKRTPWTADLDSLQLHAYGNAIANCVGASSYICGHYYPEKGEQRWWAEAMELGSFAHMDILARLQFASQNRDTVTGPHCNDCYARPQCPAWCAKAIHGIRTSDANNLDVTPDNAAERYQLWQHAKKVASVLEGAMKGHARNHGAVETRPGKVWKQGSGHMAATFDSKTFKKENPELVTKYTKAVPHKGAYRETNA